MHTTTHTTNEPLQRRRVDSPIGELSLIGTDDAIVAVLWDTESELGAGKAHNPVERHLGDVDIAELDAGACAVLDRAADQLAEYFAGTRTEFDLPLAPSGTEFQRAAWEALRRIPFGETVSYGRQADLMGDKNKARAVGAANGRNPIPIVVPCHRVVGSDGSLTGFAGGIELKRWLLDHERFTLMAAG